MIGETVGAGGRANWVAGLLPLACRDCGVEPRQGRGYLSFVSVVWCQVEVSVSGRSLLQRSPTECGVSSASDLENS